MSENNTRDFIVAFIGIGLCLIAAIVYFYTHKQGEFLAENTQTAQYASEKRDVQKELAPITATISGNPEASPQPAIARVTTAQKAQRITQADDTDTIRPIALKAVPQSHVVTLLEGERKKVFFNLVNESQGEIHVNLYKTEPAISESEAKEKLHQLLDYKRGTLKETRDFTRARNFSGASYLLPFPVAKTLQPKETATLSVTIDASDLKSSEYKSFLIAAGASDNESAIIPFIVAVAPAPKIKVSSIKVLDGSFTGTRGNNNHAANPGEKVLCKAVIKNEGSGYAKDVTIRLGSKDPALKFLTAPTIKIPYLDAQGQSEITFLATVKKDAHPSIPPVVTVTSSDNEQSTWTDTFYLGEEGKFAYPLGLQIKTEQNIKQTEDTVTTEG